MVRAADSRGTAAESGPQAAGGGSPLLGAVLGFVAAVAYTLTNMGLREAAGRGDFGWAMWVTANKAVPAASVAWLLIAWRARRGLPALPPRELVLPLIGTGLVMQLLGNVCFQLGLSFGGLALTVALTFSTLILSSALLSRMMLGETISVRTGAAMALLIAAVCLLSFGAADASRSAPAATTGAAAAAILFGCAAGCGYGFCGVMIRRAVGANLSLSATLVLLSSTGVVVMGGLAFVLLGWEQLTSVSGSLQATMLAAGMMNAVAFFSVAGALRSLEVVRVNLINTSQVAMASAAGVLFFGEVLTVRLATGIALTMAGLALMGLRRRRRRVAESDEVPLGGRQEAVAGAVGGRTDD